MNALSHYSAQWIPEDKILLGFVVLSLGVGSYLLSYVYVVVNFIVVSTILLSGYIIMFSSTGLFKRTACPEEVDCGLPNCIFSHDVRKKINGEQSVSSTQRLPGKEEIGTDDGNAGGSRKRRRVESEATETRTPPRALVQMPGSLPADTASGVDKQNVPLPRISTREISPPPFRGREEPRKALKTSEPLALNTIEASTKPSRKPAKDATQETLNPRMLPHPPASHTIRLVVVTKLHEQIVRLNDEVIKNLEPSEKGLELSKQEMVSMALDEEETTARNSHSVYSNVVRLRIVALMKMKLEEWKEYRLGQIAKDFPVVNQPPPKATAHVETGLTAQEELALLPKLLINQAALQKFGYVSMAPSGAEIAQAKKGVEAAQGWEQCDRCKTRFQVFPGRREEDGALTSGGICTYHFGKPLRPSKERSDAIKGHKDTLYSCCNEPVGASVGCIKADTHVFKISEAKRLASVLPFERTPVNENTEPAKAVCFDCEMGYTVYGLELIRLTATAWPRGEELLDVLVRPMGELLDLNSRFSGVWPRHFADAIPYGTSLNQNEEGSEMGEVAERKLKIVDSPAMARSLVFQFLTPETPLIGHAIENDLNATRIVHPSIIDTVVLYPHPRGLPLRYGLKMLARKHLDRNIQMGGELGHDSKEDARTAGDLVRLKVGQIWKVMVREGWTIRGGELHPPSPAPTTTTTPKISKLAELSDARTRR